MAARDDASDTLSAHLAENVRFLRQQRDLTQARLAKLASLPRPTLALIESGSANPTLAVLARLSAALGVTIDELLSAPHPQLQVFRRGALPTKTKGADASVTVMRLLPDPIPGLDIERLELAPGARMGGVPHRAGTREYLACERGELTLVAAGEKVALAPGDVVAFQGDQAHSYVNTGRTTAVAFSVVALAPPTLVRTRPA
ncbi:XRE family transcriptional regulator [Myxococcota bacterium]|nr:XRE family transcriptional regulator [Myxococcota bacterium]